MKLDLPTYPKITSINHTPSRAVYNQPIYYHPNCTTKNPIPRRPQTANLHHLIINLSQFVSSQDRLRVKTWLS